ncbi:hypothetical protein HBH56_166320 [Parastagonospora nodorum]|nr:hypothetical protein HBH56_166320 [Parastagonospora nodorum]KAH3936309.1 hypothetical protein HBH54_029400 [Parastagonospora nodorum]KAH3997183.1 hypothetical protein HBI10_147430 [Parastagonospora nodorum]KAH4019986.1 hypothetical protein HBI13_120580 [Parastagonospora nodorum]KAH4110110.1 hypothetical protein HBH46_020950 [Parastagonospora nodorum]
MGHPDPIGGMSSSILGIMIYHHDFYVLNERQQGNGIETTFKIFATRAARAEPMVRDFDPLDCYDSGGGKYIQPRLKGTGPVEVGVVLKWQHINPCIIQPVKSLESLWSVIRDCAIVVEVDNQPAKGVAEDLVS